MITMFAQSEGGVWMPPQASTVAGGVDELFFLILWICVAMFFLILGAMILFVVKYRQRPGYTPVRSPSHSTALELTWTIVPTIVVMVIFYMGFRGYLNLATPPPNAYEIQVAGTKAWTWEFTYPNGHIDSTLHVPLNRPVRLLLTSDNVIHSLYIPAFRVKKDVVPGRTNFMWFQATHEGEFDVYCAEYCGSKHSKMLTKVVVQEPTVFNKWLEDAANFVDRMPPAEAGKLLYERRGCAQCHTIDRRDSHGPTFKGLFGKSRPLKDGSTVVVDENYVRESILFPANKVAAGFDNIMPSYQGRLKDNEIAALIAYLKTLKE